MAVLPMFPLGTVLLPHMVLPLHVFEPRYRALMHDVMSAGREFGVVLISRGPEVGGDDQRVDIGTVASVVEAEELEDGRWLVVAVGTRRIRVDHWLPDAPYPIAQTTLLPGGADGRDATERVGVLAARLRRVLALRLELGHEGVGPAVELAEDADTACWQAAVLAPLNPLDAQRVLEVDDTSRRIELLDGFLAEIEDTLQLLRGG